MEYNYEKVAQSLRLMYVGNIIIIASILCTILAWIIPPLVFLVSMAVLGGDGHFVSGPSEAAQ